MVALAQRNRGENRATEPPGIRHTQRYREAATSRPSPNTAATDDGVETIRILLADDHAVMRRSLRSVIESQPDLKVVAEAADGEEAVDLTQRMQPHVVVMDVQMPRLDGIEATRRITQQFTSVRVVGLSMRDDDVVASTMMRAGAALHLPKGAPLDELYQAIRTAASME